MRFIIKKIDFLKSKITQITFNIPMIRKLTFIKTHVDPFNTDCMIMLQNMHQEQEIVVKNLQDSIVSEEDMIKEIERIKSHTTQTINDLTNSVRRRCSEPVEEMEEVVKRIMLVASTTIYLVEKASDAIMATIKLDKEIQKVKAEAAKKIAQIKRNIYNQLEDIETC